MARSVFLPTLVIALGGPAALLACVGDAPIVQPSVDAAVDSGSDVAVDSGGDVAVDTGVDAGPCSNAIPGNSVNLPTGGSSLIPQGGGPLLAGDYVLTNINADCIPCDLKGGGAVGGLHITTSGPNLTIERRIEYQIVSQPQLQVLDRWTGTYDQLNAKVSMTSVCPKSGTSATWQAYLPVGSDGGAPSMIIRFPSGEFRGQRLDGGADAGPNYTFTFTKK